MLAAALAAAAGSTRSSARCRRARRRRRGAVARRRAGSPPRSARRTCRAPRARARSPARAIASGCAADEVARRRSARARACRTMPEIARSVVVLPAPLGPRIATTWPSSTAKSTPRSTSDLAVPGLEVLDLEQAHSPASQVGLDHRRVVAAPRAARPRRSCGRSRARRRCSQTRMTIPMWCSTSSTVRSNSSRSATISVAELVDLARG